MCIISNKMINKMLDRFFDICDDDQTAHDFFSNFPYETYVLHKVVSTICRETLEFCKKEIEENKEHYMRILGLSI